MYTNRDASRSDETSSSVAELILVGFEPQFAEAVEERPEGPIAVFIVRFAGIDDISVSLGPSTASRVIELAIEVIRSAVPPAAIVGRIYGEVVAVAVPDLQGLDAIGLAEELSATLHEPLTVDNVPIVVGARVGLAQFPVHGDTAESVLAAAAIAERTATLHGEHFHVIADADFRTHAQLKMILTEFLGALESDQLEPWYQPKIDLRSGACVGLEALVRWRHPERGLLGPGEFLPTVERTGLIHEMTSHMIELVLAQLRRWKKHGNAVPVAINLSPRDLIDSALPKKVEAMVGYHGLHPGLVEFEVTETVMMQDINSAVGFLRDLRNRGFRIAIDDFGTGHSSLSYLRDLPVNTLKIDRSFVRTFERRDGLGSILKAFITMARDLGLQSVAEGIEDAKTLDSLRDLGCAQGQGYFIAKPAPAEETMKWLAANTESSIVPRPGKA